MRVLRASYRLIGFVLLLVSFLGCTAPFWLCPRRLQRRVRRVTMRIAVFHSGAMARILGLKVELGGEAHWLQTPGAKLLVCNHLGYLDILAFALHFPSCFVTSREIQRTPFLGTLVTAAGCLFVDRQDKRGLGREVRELAEAMGDGLNVAIFPEATSTNGEAVLRFRRPLFNAALAAGVPVIPLTLNYTFIDGQAANRANRDLVCWYGDMDFAPHFQALLGLKDVQVTLCVGAPIAPAGDATSLALAAETAVRTSFIPFSGPVPAPLNAMEA